MDERLIRSVAAAIVLLILGTLTCLPMYPSVKAFLGSELWTKIRWWIPIFIGFLIVIYGGLWAASVISIALVVVALFESNTYINKRRVLVPCYTLLIALSLLHLPLYPSWAWAQAALIIVCFSSVLSDVTAFFAGKYLGAHRLPTALNYNKSWEGVAGQLIGGVIGSGVAGFILNIPWPLFAGLLIGAASASGDLANSYVKRQLKIKDWGDSIPGHGGVLDRFASLSVAIAAGYWLYVLGYVQ